MSMNGAPAKIILVHGTWGRGFDQDKDAQRMPAGKPVAPRWFEAGSKFCMALSSGLAGAAQPEQLALFGGASAKPQQLRAKLKCHSAASLGA